MVSRIFQVLTISGSFEAVSPVESEIVRAVSLSTMEITNMARFKRKSSGWDTLNLLFRTFSPVNLLSMCADV